MKAIIGKNYLKPEIKVIKVHQGKYLCQTSDGKPDGGYNSRSFDKFIEEDE